MAGIGFELKKIFKEGSLTRTVIGAGYSTVITLGPTFSIMAAIIILYILLGFSSIPYADRALISSTILYIFIFSVILTAPFSSVFSRYIADKIYEEKFEDILPSFYTGITINVVLGAIIAFPFAWRLITVGQVSAFFAFHSVLTFLTLIIVLFSMIYLHATKDYKIITFDFLLGMSIGIFVAILLNKFKLVNPIEAILYGLEIGLFIISFLEFSYIRKYFHVKSDNYFECVRYIGKHHNIFLCNLFYTLGLYAHNFVFWASPMKIVVANSYYSMQSYDMATCLAMFTNISTMILFTVMAETKFHDKYQIYNSAVVTSTLEQITKYKKSMFRLLVQETNLLISIQAIISIIIFLFIVIFLPDYGFGGMVMTIYPSLAAAFYVIFIMYSNIIFLYYFNDSKGALITSLCFVISTLIGSIIATHFRVEFYGAGAFAGAVIGWTFSYFRIHYLEKNFERHIFCNAHIIERKKGRIPDGTIYRRNHNEDKTVSL
ncbi:MAG TPA: hypothetical protein DIW41_07975 [Lachnospiraceae bacterium]|jgi:uncharacterized membrane protein|nr:hypothetical protein [Lachnospiraceae bacterium]